jgi:hypothetical protein
MSVFSAGRETVRVLCVDSYVVTATRVRSCALCVCVCDDVSML